MTNGAFLPMFGFEIAVKRRPFFFDWFSTVRLPPL